MSVTILDIIKNVSLAGWGMQVAGLFVALFWAVIFWQDVEKRSNKLFFIFSVVVFVWGVAAVFWEVAAETLFANTLVGIFYFVGGLIAPTLLFAIDSYSDKDGVYSSRGFVPILGPYIVLSLAFFVPGLIVGYERAIDDIPGKIVFGKLFIAYALYALVLVVLNLVHLIKKYKESAGIFKIQMRNFILLFGATSLIALFWTLLIPAISGNQDHFWIGYVFGALLFLVFTGITVIKYEFWSPKVIATELFISLIITVLFAEIFITSSFLDLLIKTGITLVVIFSSSFLVESVKREIKSKDKIIRLSHDIEIISKRLKVLDKKKSDFLSIASHHLRDPLTAIKGYASMILDGSFGDLSRPVREAVEKIFDSSERLITMISDFMDISRIESGDMNYNFADVDMREMVLELASEMKPSAAHAHLPIDVVVDDEGAAGVPFVTVGDAGKLRQVISNLIDNSIKYTPHGNISMRLSMSPDKKKIIFSQSDTGIGMSALTKEKIFRKFSRADGVSKVYTEGTGLGLYVAKEIIKKHEGRIWAESKGEGQGSTFYVELEAKR